MLSVVFGLQVGSSVWYLITFYRTRHQSLDDCINGSTDANRIAYCKSLDAYKHIPQGVMLASIIVPIVLQACQSFFLTSSQYPNISSLSPNLDACYVVYQYTKRLEHQKLEKQRASRSFPTSGPVYQAVQPHDEHYPLNQPHVQYPYADAPNSFGSHKV